MLYFETEKEDGSAGHGNCPVNISADAEIFLYAGYGLYAGAYKAGAGRGKPGVNHGVGILVSPCAIINAFQIAYTRETIQGLLLAFAAAIAIHVVYLGLIGLLGRLWKFSAIERASVMYSNAGNMIIPVVLSVLGPEWVLYSSAFISVQITLQWTHARGMISHEKGVDLKKLFTNVNIISILVGLALFLLGVRLPTVMTDTLKTVGGLMAPLGMFVMGMLMAGNSLKKSFSNPQIYKIALLRLCLCPLMMLGLIRLTEAYKLLPDAATVLYISFLACTTPPSVTTTQLAVLYHEDAGYSSAINIVSTILCLATIPLMTMLYWHVVG